MNNTVIEVKKLRSDAVIPTRGSEYAAGADVYAVETVEILPGKRALVSTGLSMAIPNNMYIRVAPRSGLAVKQGIDVLAGVVDSDYRGELKVALINLGQERFIVKPGDRIAQIILEQIKLPSFLEVDSLSDTNRGTGGFGSTGA
jgi:dUTP pyrophosphatase